MIQIFQTRLIYRTDNKIRALLNAHRDKPISLISGDVITRKWIVNGSKIRFKYEAMLLRRNKNFFLIFFRPNRKYVGGRVKISPRRAAISASDPPIFEAAKSGVDPIPRDIASVMALEDFFMVFTPPDCRISASYGGWTEFRDDLV